MGFQIEDENDDPSPEQPSWVKGKQIMADPSFLPNLTSHALNLNEEIINKSTNINDENDEFLQYTNSQNFTSFPHLTKIEELIIVKNELKEIPESILKLTTLKKLDVQMNMIEVIPPNIKNLINLEKFYLDNNNIKEIPNEISELTNLKILGLRTNYIEEIPPAILNLPRLKLLGLSENSIKSIPSDIQNLSQIENLFLNQNNITALPYEIFNLQNLKKLDLCDNKDLKTKVINFSNSTIENCYFCESNISCYQPNTCKNIHKKNNYEIDYNNFEKLYDRIDSNTERDNKNDRNDKIDKPKNDIIDEKDLKQCTKEEIDEILNQIKNGKTLNQNQNSPTTNQNNNKKGKFPFIMVGIIIGGAVVVLIITLISCILIKRIRSKKDNKSDFKSNDKFRSESFKFLLNKKQRRKNSNSSGKSKSHLKQGNISPKTYGSPTLPGGTVVINNIQKPTSYVPLFNSNNIKYNEGSLDMQNLLHSYDKTNIMMMDDDKNI